MNVPHGNATRTPPGPAARAGFAACVAFTLWAAAGCSGRHESRREAAPVTVTLIRVETAGHAPGLELAARVRSREEVTLSSTTGGRVTSLPFAEGRAFAAGQALARFEATEAVQSLAAARASARAAESRRVDARRQEARIDSLYALRVVSARDAEIARTEARAAEAAAAEAAARLATLEAAQTLPAPFAGVVVRRHVDVGAVVQTGQAVLDVRSHSTNEVEVAVPESDLDRARTGRAWIDAGDGAWQPARITRLEGATDYASRTRVAVLVPATRMALEPGAFVRVRFDAAASAGRADSGAADAVVRVPAASLIHRGGLTGAFVVRDGHARLRWLRTGAARGDRVEVLAGLSAGETIARDPAGLTDGVAVQARP